MKYSMSKVKSLGIKFKDTKSVEDFNELYETLRPFVINNYKTTFSCSESVIEDSYQEAMVDIWTNVDNIDLDKYSIATTAYTKTCNNIKNMIYKDTRDLGKESVFGSHLDKVKSKGIKHPKLMKPYFMEFLHDNSVEESLVTQDDIDLFWGRLDGVKYIDILKLWFIDGYNYGEIANIKDIPLSTVKNRIRSAKYSVKCKLEKNEKVF